MGNITLPCKKFAEEEMRHLTICDKVMSEKGKVNLNFSLCLLNGAPRVGKSTFLSRITGRQLPHSADDERLISETPSTGVAERVLQVVIKKTSFTIAMASQVPQALQSGMNWQIITLSQEAVMILKAILSSQSSLALEQQESQIPPTTPSDLAPTTSEGLSSEATVADTNRKLITVEHADAVLSRLGFFNLDRRKKSQHRIPGYQAPLEIFQKAMRSNEWTSAEDLFKQSLTLYFTDVGGQPEFQEVLPAIIAGPSVFFIIFKLPDHLHQKYRVRYIETSCQSVEYESSFTVLDSILQSLASIASTCSYVGRSGGKLVAIQPKVVLVGTHKDQTDPNHISKVQRELREVLIGTEYYKNGIIAFASPDDPALTINSLSNDEGDAYTIRHLVEDIASKPAFTVSVPAPWLALLLSFRCVESSVVSYEDCLHMAKDCGIHDDEELKEALWFLHTKLGVIRYFHEIPELSDIVICDPQVIFDKITRLITCTFTFEKTRDPHASEEFKKKGIFSARILDELSSCSDEPLSGSKLVTLLKHLRIVAPIHEEEEQLTESPSHYLIPCALSHAPVLSERRCTLNLGKRRRSVSLDYPESHNIPSLCVLFQCGYCPKGIFGALIADLMDCHSGNLRWRLKDDTIYRNQVSFHVGREYHIVKISFFSTFLEVDIASETNCAKFQQKKNAESVCNDIRLDLEHSLVSVSRTLHYGHGARFFFGFHCSCDGSTPAKCDEDDPVVMRCDRCGSTTDLQDNHTIWYGKKRIVEHVLSIKDLQKVQRAAWEARAKWYNIGLELKIDPGTLDVINRKFNSDNIDDRFRDMLSIWLNMVQPQPTLSLLAEALQSPTVGYAHLAEQILSTIEY